MYLIGIDLGTTHISCAFAKKQGEIKIEQFLIPQYTDLGQIENKSLFPSCLYAPLDEEKKELSSFSTSHIAGYYAKKRGAGLPERWIASAKSWLCHPLAHLRGVKLPLSSQDEITLTPKEAIRTFLTHLKEAWEKDHTDAPLKEQTVVITVPASFDPAARDLVLKASQEAGYPEIFLLEEPESALFAWLQETPHWREQISLGDKILVVDVGGGTTDFTLLEAKEEKGELILQKLAVGPHLLLGGDNMDLTLAAFIEEELSQKGVQLDEWQKRTLVPLARDAKEALLSNPELKTFNGSIPGKGRKLIGGSIAFEVKQETLNQAVIDAFFPKIAPDTSLMISKTALQALSLPYSRDPRIPAHLAEFLHLGRNEKSSLFPTKLLLNGGVFRSPLLKKRLVEIVSDWSEALTLPAPELLQEIDLELAVSRGAVAYASTLHGHKVKVKRSTAQSYFVGIEESAPAIPGMQPKTYALCIAPQGLEEGKSVELKAPTFLLTLNQPVSFRFFSRSQPENADRPGEMVKNLETLREMKAIETTLSSTEEGVPLIEVFLKTHYNPKGFLELSCESNEGKSWKLEF